MLLEIDKEDTFHWPRAHLLTCSYLPTNNGLLMRNTVSMFVGNDLLLATDRSRHFALPSPIINGLDVSLNLKN